MENKSKGTLVKVSIFLAIIATIIIIFFATYYFFINKSFKSYESNVNTIVDSINKVNASIGDLDNKDKFDPKATSEQLWSKMKPLNNIKSKLNKIKPTKKYKDSYNYLSKGLNYNISMYNYLTTLLNDPKSKEYQKTIDNIKASYRECEQHYSLFSMDKFSLNIPKNVESLINTSINYVYDEIKNHRDKEISENQLLEFSNKMDNAYSEFSKIKKDYFVLLDKVRNKEFSYDELYNTVEKDLSKIEDISKNFYSISIPENQMKIYNSLKTLLNDYEDYTENFKYTLSIEKIKVKNNDVDMDSLNALYNTSNAKLSNIKIDHENFINQYKEFKKSIYK